ncbi:hypothetical protein ACLBX9_09590 [Methylobacterium sp. A49B]
MKLHGLRLQRHGGGVATLRSEGKVAVAVRKTRGCSDGQEIAAENDERVWVASALDCGNCGVVRYPATTTGVMCIRWYSI